MSIILDALKKAEGDKEAPSAEESDPIERVEKATASIQAPFAASAGKSVKSGGDKKRLVLLGGIALVVFLGVVGGKFLMAPDGPISFVMGFFKKDNAVPVAVTPPVVPPAPAVSGANPLPVDPKNSQAGIVAEEKEEKTEPVAEKSVSKTSEDSPEIKDLKAKAIQSFKEGDADTALAAYEKLIQLNSTDAELYNNYGVALKKQGKVEEAKKNYLTALTINPNYIQAMNNLAVIYMAESKYVAAKDLLRQAMGIDPGYVDLYLHLAIALEKNGEFEAAKEYYSTFLKMSEKKIDRKVRLQVEERLSQLKDR